MKMFIVCLEIAHRESSTRKNSSQKKRRHKYMLVAAFVVSGALMWPVFSSRNQHRGNHQAFDDEINQSWCVFYLNLVFGAHISLYKLYQMKT